MTQKTSSREELLSLVDVEKGLVDRRIYSDRDLYELEMERIFARAWNFVAHDTQIPNPGDFFMNFIGEDRVIVVRDNDGLPQVLINSCRHRGNAVCRAEEGHSTSFMCTYHGWTYDLQGRLVGVPGFKEVYHEELDRENWGLIKARVETYQGFIFACLDTEAAPLDEFLGDVGRMCINLLVARGPLKIAGGIQKWTIGCNWKFAADNVWDYYHAGITHFSATVAGWQGRPLRARQSRWGATHLSVLGEYGHAIGGPETSTATIASKAPYDNVWREDPERREFVGPLGQRAHGNLHLFPNVWIQQGFWQVSLRLPKGPTTTEIWWFVFTSESLDDEAQRTIVRRSTRHNGPAGMFEIDDGENWGESTRGTVGVISRRYPLHYAMNLGHGELQSDDESQPPYITSLNAEHAQLWHYRAWSEWMAAESWDDLRTSHSIPHGTT